MAEAGLIECRDLYERMAVFTEQPGGYRLLDDAAEAMNQVDRQNAVLGRLVASRVIPAPRAAGWMRDDGMRPVVFSGVAVDVPAINIIDPEVWAVTVNPEGGNCFGSSLAANKAHEPFGEKHWRQSALDLAQVLNGTKPNFDSWAS